MRVLIADGHHLVREGIRLILESDSSIEVVASEDRGDRALESILRHRPDVAVVDVLLPRLSGLSIVERLGDASVTRCMILTSRHSHSLVNQALRVGALGYVLKSASPQQLVEAIRAVAGGLYYLSPAVAGHVVDVATRRRGRVVDGFSQLTAREREVLKLIGEGLSTKEVADALGISQRTADGHRAHVMSKLSIRKVSGLVRFAIREGLVEL